MKHFFLLLLLAGFSLSATADTLKLTGVGGASSDGVYVYPYYFTTTLDGVTKTSVPLMCVDFNREITFGEQWQVKEIDIPRDNSLLSQQLRALAVIDYETQLGSSAISTTEYQFAAWNIFDPTDLVGKNGLTTAARGVSSGALLAGAGLTPLPVGFSYSDFVFFMPTIDQTGWTHGIPQRFVGLVTPEFRAHNVPPSPTPEPSGLLLLGTGIFGMAGVMYRRVRSAVAGC